MSHIFDHALKKVTAEISLKIDQLIKNYKPYQVYRIHYAFCKYNRQLSNEPYWQRYRGYQTREAANDAIKALRKSDYDKVYYDYPGTDNELEYPHIRPTISIWRYKIVCSFEVVF